MANIKIDVEYVLDEASKANSSLEELKDNLNKLRNTYQDILDDQKSDEFIKEFKESLGEILEKTEELSNSAIGEIIAGLETIAEEIDNIDNEIATAGS